MNIDIPRELGTVVAGKLRPDRPNIIFGADMHTSLGSHRNLTFLYLHLAESTDLTIVGIENKPKRTFIPKGPRRQIGRDLREFITSGMADEVNELAWEHPELIRRVATISGFELLQPDAGADKTLTDIHILYRGYSSLPQALRQVFHPYYADALSRTLDCLPEEHRNIVAERTNALIDTPSESIYESLLPDLHYLRTEDQMRSTFEAMNERNQNLALVCRGQNHRGEFIDAVTRKGWGYLVFEPAGINRVDPMMHEIYSRRFQEEFRRLLLG